LQEVEAICDRVIIINKGQLVADDTLSNLQRANKKNHVVVVQFKEDIESNLLQKIGEVSTIEKLPTSNPGGSGQTVKFQTSNPEEVRKQILELALLHNLNIVSLQSEEQSLEDVFRSLTQKTE